MEKIDYGSLLENPLDPVVIIMWVRESATKVKKKWQKGVTLAEASWDGEEALMGVCKKEKWAEERQPNIHDLRLAPNLFLTKTKSKKLQSVSL